MTKEEARLKGTRNSSIARKQEAIENYYKNPKICENCGEIIHLRPNRPPWETRRLRFCCSSCATSCNNRKFDRWSQRKDKVPDKGKCKECGIEIEYPRVKDRPYSRRRIQYCDDCRSIVRSEKARKLQRENGNGFSKPPEEMTKGELKKECEGKHFLTFRNTMSKMARKNYQASDRPKQCKVCGYEKHYEVCHLRSITEFPDDALVSEINHVSNLEALCPTHHWELDKGLLSKETLKTKFPEEVMTA